VQIKNITIRQFCRKTVNLWYLSAASFTELSGLLRYVNKPNDFLSGCKAPHVPKYSGDLTESILSDESNQRLFTRHALSYSKERADDIRTLPGFSTEQEAPTERMHLIGWIEEGVQLSIKFATRI
jgi:hypothetical protein